ncbi:neurogenic locus notch homolog protein 1, partial [Striga asiatica]
MEDEVVHKLTSFQLSEKEAQPIAIDVSDTHISAEVCKRNLFGKIHGQKKAQLPGLRRADYPHLHHNSSHTSNSESPKPSNGSPSKPAPPEKASSQISESDHQPSHKPSSPQPNHSTPIIPSPPAVHSILPINSQADHLMMVDTLCPTAKPSLSTPLSADLIPIPSPSIKARKWRRKPNSKATLNYITIPPTSPIVTRDLFGTPSCSDMFGAAARPFRAVVV